MVKTNKKNGIPLTDIMVKRIKKRMETLHLTMDQTRISPCHDYPNISIDQFRSIMEFKESKKPKNKSRSITQIQPWMLEVLRENLRCSINYLKGIDDEPNKDNDGNEHVMPLIFENGSSKEKLKKRINKLGHKIESLDNQKEINILYYIFIEADDTTRKQIITDLSEYVNEHKKMSFTAEKWQQAKSLQEKQAALSLIYNIGIGDDIQKIIECFFDAEVYYNKRSYYKAIIRYSKVIISAKDYYQLKPYFFDAIARLQYIIDHEDNIDEEYAEIDKLNPDDRYIFFSPKFSNALDEVKPLIKVTSKPTKEQIETISFLKKLSTYTS